MYKRANKIFKRVKRGFVWTSDIEAQGRIEHWQIPPDIDQIKDDCDGFALACRFLCDEKGIKSRLILCITAAGEGHLVLAVGNYILDNTQWSIQTKSKLERKGYKWIAFSGLNRGDDWNLYKT